ncbi:hypothetical protein HYU96_01770 [Candidatus Daviesbacteria bacterium]|nr:hypothetical protein [Candidatus Daviesbacteria bacterium]
MKKIALILLVVLLSAVIFQKPLATHLKIILFITEEFPQIPIKPLGLLTGRPIHQKVELNSSSGKIVGDLFIPITPLNQNPSIILAMGIKTSEKDKPILLHFGQTLARLGYMTFWPRLEVLDKGESLPEEAETFIEAFKYLEERSARISFVGFSVGSSTAFIAASNPEIADKVHSLVFFGGYFDLFDYLMALSSKMIVNGEKVPWEPVQDAIDHTGGLLGLAGIKLEEFKSGNLDYGQESKYQSLLRFSPSQKIKDFKGKIFILHDKSDSYVPYTESIKLFKALPKNQIAAYHISDLFEHVQPNRPINIFELVKLYGFLYKVLSSL